MSKKTAKLSKKSDKDLVADINQLREEIASYRRDQFTTEQKNIHKRKLMKRDLARMLTLQNQRLVEQDATETDAKEETA